MWPDDGPPRGVFEWLLFVIGCVLFLVVPFILLPVDSIVLWLIAVIAVTCVLPGALIAYGPDWLLEPSQWRRMWRRRRGRRSAARGSRS